jgi:hypothetical protein
MVAQYHKYTRPRGSVHDLALALSLKDQGTNVLCVSDATLYVLQNYMALDIGFKSRWAVEKLQDVYYPIDQDHADYGAWVDLVHQIQSEVQDMSCDIIAALEETNTQLAAIVAAIEAQTTAIEDQTTATTPDTTLIDDIEELLENIGVSLGAEAILGA